LTDKGLAPGSAQLGNYIDMKQHQPSGTLEIMSGISSPQLLERGSCKGRHVLSNDVADGKRPPVIKSTTDIITISSQTDGNKKQSADEPYKNDKTTVNRQQQTLLFFL
jgi:hypothetical protein